MLSEEDKTLTINKFKKFLKGLTFPIQISCISEEYDYNDLFKDFNPIDSENMNNLKSFIINQINLNDVCKKTFIIAIPADDINKIKVIQDNLLFMNLKSKFLNHTDLIKLFNHWTLDNH